MATADRRSQARRAGPARCAGRRRWSVRAAGALAAGAIAVGLAASPAPAVPDQPARHSRSAPDPEPTARDRAAQECLAGDRVLEVIGADHEVPWPLAKRDIAPGTAFDARSEVFDNSVRNEDGFATGVKVHRAQSRRDLCFVGGSIRSSFDPETTPWDSWHRITAMIVENPGFTVVGTTFFNEGDLLAFVGAVDGWRVVGVRADGGSTHPGAYGHDDCIENDSMASGLVDDSKFDGCLVFLSATNSSEIALDGSDDEVVVRDTLVRLQPFQNSYNAAKYGENEHGGFFKWARTSDSVMVPPALTISDSVFRSDTPAKYGGNENGFLGLPPGTRCERVTLVGTESWPAADLASWTDQCTDLRLGTIADWDAAVARWDAAHPPMRDLHGQARDLVIGSSGW